MRKRLEWIDIIKGICILAVVFFHIDFIPKNIFEENIHNYLQSLTGIFKVTLFYCVAGLTINNEKIKNTKDFLLHKLKKLYIKVIIIGIISIIMHNIFIKIGFYEVGTRYSGKIMSAYNIKDFIKNVILTFLLANREVILGAMWFVYTLIIDFILLSIIELIVNKFNFIKNKRETRLLICFLLMNISIFFSSIIGITIPRFNNSLVGLFLMDFTNYIYTNKYIKFTNSYLFLVCLVLFLLAPFYGNISMNINEVTNPAFLLVYVSASLYVISYISIKISNYRKKSILSIIGKHSFSIMAFHFIGFKIGTILLKLIGIEKSLSQLSPKATSPIYLLYYCFFGIVFSIVISKVMKKTIKFEF